MPNVKNYIFENLNYVDLTLYQYGIEDCAPMHMYGPVKRNHFLLHYVLKGKGRLQMPNGKLIFNIREAINYIEQHYYREISVENIAEWCNLNRSYFSKLFKSNMSVSPQTFLLEYRIKKACDLLSKTTNPISEIAAAVGYQNQLHFSRAFKNQMGMAPRDFRLSHKEVIS